MRQAAAITSAATNTVRARTNFQQHFQDLLFGLFSSPGFVLSLFTIVFRLREDNKLQKLFCLIAFVFLSCMVQCGGDGEDRCHLAFVWENHTGDSLKGVVLLFYW